jgi:hypothetical protein
MTFVHHFNRSLSAIMTVEDSPPTKGVGLVQAIEWTGRPSLEHAREYIDWCHVVYSHLADHWEMRLMRAVQTGPTRWEIWAYMPGEPPKQFAELPHT